MGETDVILSKETHSNQFSSVLFVHSSGWALVVKALGQSVYWLVHYNPGGVL